MSKMYEWFGVDRTSMRDWFRLREWFGRQERYIQVTTVFIVLLWVSLGVALGVALIITLWP